MPSPPNSANLSSFSDHHLGWIVLRPGYKKEISTKIQESLYFLRTYPVFAVFGALVLAFTGFGDKIKSDSPGRRG